MSRRADVASAEVGPLHLWRLDWTPRLRALVRAEAAALDVGLQVAPGLFLGARPFEPGRAAFAVGGGALVARGRPEDLAAPEGLRRVKVPTGPWKPSGNPTTFLRRVAADLVAAPRREAELELYPVADERDWLLVRPGRWPPHFAAPDLPVRTSSSLSSRLARAVVNLVAGPGERVWDPLCGTGVLLVEALRCGCRARGSDLNPKACAGARRNLAALGLEAPVEVRDALASTDAERLDALVADLPYGMRLEPCDYAPLLRALPPRARRWALVAARDLSAELAAAGSPARLTIEVPKPTFSRYVHVGGPPRGA